MSDVLKPCPFCGGEPRTATYETESLWSHDQVTYTKVFCDECDVGFDTEPGHLLQAHEAWNRRAAPSVLVEQDKGSFSLCENTQPGAEGAVLADLVTVPFKPTVEMQDAARQSAAKLPMFKARIVWYAMVRAAKASGLPTTGAAK